MTNFHHKVILYTKKREIQATANKIEMGQDWADFQRHHGHQEDHFWMGNEEENKGIAIKTLNYVNNNSDQLNELGIQLEKGYEASKLPEADLYVIGNALSRGNECVEEILNKKSLEKDEKNK